MEAGPRLGGAFRLAGLQPRRSQISELIEWYARELERLDVRVDVNHPMFADDILAFGADAVVMATGSQPSGTGFQRPLPLVPEMPGVQLANVHAIEDVMSHRARLGRRVVLVDDLGDWRGTGTAWFLAERDHEVVIVTPHPLVGFNIQRTNADYALRSRLWQLGVRWHTDSVVTAWTGTSATVQSLLDGSFTDVQADALVLATTNAPEDSVLRELGDQHPDVRAVGDVVAARLAVHAIYEGRVAGMAL
jgi:pyruvate/2-oxoglutarate dehydrogenase complex dihydrolipoamide dehydrogenase (E3) component